MCMYIFQGRRWVNSVRLCLMNQLLHSSVYRHNGQCSAISSFAYASHPYCYTSAGFCTVILRSWQNWRALSKTIDFRDLFSSSGGRAMCSTLRRCVSGPNMLPNYAGGFCNLQAMIIADKSSNCISSYSVLEQQILGS